MTEARTPTEPKAETRPAAPAPDQAALMKALYGRLGGGRAGHARFWWAKYARAVRSATARFLKRAVDVTVAATMLVLLSPLFALVALLIKLTDGGSVLFWQKRVGRWGR